MKNNDRSRKRRKKTETTTESPSDLGAGGLWPVPSCSLCSGKIDQHSVVLDGKVICLNCVWTRVFGGA